MLISGPSTANRPGASWYGTWLQYAVQNNVIPDQYSWHDEPGDPQSDYAAHNSALAKYGAPTRPININVNVSATNSTIIAYFNGIGIRVLRSTSRRRKRLVHQPVLRPISPFAHSHFEISLERINANGLRGNWLSGCQLHDFLSSLLTKSTNSCGASNYSPK
jgi:hypothetical protein